MLVFNKVAVVHKEYVNIIARTFLEAIYMHAIILCMKLRIVLQVRPLTAVHVCCSCIRAKT